VNLNDIAGPITILKAKVVETGEVEVAEIGEEERNFLSLTI
jgi:hypothetical protein